MPLVLGMFPAHPNLHGITGSGAGRAAVRYIGPQEPPCKSAGARISVTSLPAPSSPSCPVLQPADSFPGLVWAAHTDQSPLSKFFSCQVELEWDFLKNIQFHYSISQQTKSRLLVRNLCPSWKYFWEKESLELNRWPRLATVGADIPPPSPVTLSWDNRWKARIFSSSSFPFLFPPVSPACLL